MVLLSWLCDEAGPFIPEKILSLCSRHMPLYTADWVTNQLIHAFLAYFCDLWCDSNLAQVELDQVD